MICSFLDERMYVYFRLNEDANNEDNINLELGDKIETCADIECCPLCLKHADNLYESSFSPEKYPMVWCDKCGGRCVIIRNTAVLVDGNRIRCDVARIMRIVGPQLMLLAPELVPEKRIISFIKYIYENDIRIEEYLVDDEKGEKNEIAQCIKNFIHPDAKIFKYEHLSEPIPEEIFNVSLPVNGYNVALANDIDDLCEKNDKVKTIFLRDYVGSWADDGQFVFLKCLNESTGESFITTYCGLSDAFVESFCRSLKK